jgi:UDP-N-acetylmuramoylalanine--D-glutamate ligase
MAVTKLPRLPREFRPVALRGRKVLVLGLGTFGGGLGAALHLIREGADVTVADLGSAEKLAGSLKLLAAGAPRLILGRHPTAREIEAADWICASPAVPWTAPPLVEAARLGRPVECELTLLMRLLPCPSLGITGTNGKSTTTMLAERTLAASGRRVFGGGNIGGSLLDQVSAMKADDAVVLEISSFQLEHLGEIGIGPTVGLVTNVTPDHLDRHGTFAAYVEAKRQILTSARTAVLQRADPSCREFATRFGGDVLWFGDESEFHGDEPGARLRDGRFAIWRGRDGRSEQVDLEPLRLRGNHNRWNLLGAATAATCFEVGFSAAARAGLDAVPLKRRLNELGRKHGVLFVDDSVSTSPPAVAAALSSFDGPIRLLVGGYDKGIEQAPLLGAIARHCRKAYLYGAVAPTLARRLQMGAAGDENGSPSFPARSDPRWELFTRLEDAFAAAVREAESGETVLFSPGFASYDQFRNFTERGDLFCALYAALPSA